MGRPCTRGRTTGSRAQNPTLDMDAIGAAFTARVAAACPEHADFAARVLARLPRERWMLEWHLPWWLGLRLGLDPAVARALVLSNVLGLVALRLRDDLADGEVDAAEVHAATALSAVLYAEAVAIHRDYLPADSPLWDTLAASMAAWEAATDAHRPDGHPPAAARRFDVIARKGAPLNVSAVGVCLLAGRPDLIPRVTALVDHALAAWILADDLDDWVDDLRGGRWNAFVAALAPGPQDADRFDAIVGEMRFAMLTGTRLRGYFQRIRREAEQAATIGDELGLDALSAHVRDFGRRHARRGAELQRLYHSVTERATVAVFGEPS